MQNYVYKKCNIIYTLTVFFPVLFFFILDLCVLFFLCVGRVV